MPYLTQISKYKKIRTVFIYIIIIALAVSPAFALGEDNRNLFLIGIMFITPLFIFAYFRLYRTDIILLFFMASIIIFPLVNHPETMRWSTVLYSILFCLTFLSYIRLLYHNHLSIHGFHTLLKNLIYAYCIVLLIQQFCVLFGLPIFNVSNYNIDEPWKLNSLASEPSHSARIVALLMFCHIVISELILNRSYNIYIDFFRDKWVWISFLWTMLTMGSGTAFLFIPIILLKFINIRNIIPAIIIFVLIIFSIDVMKDATFLRAYDTFIATLSLDENTIIETDHSASFRIVPLIVLSSMVNISTIDGWFGHGVDNVSTFLYKYIPYSPENLTGGGLLQIWMEFGFISFLVFTIFSFTSTFYRRNYISIIFWLLLVFVNGINGQIIWLCIILLFTTNYFYKNGISNNLKQKSVN